ncbi:MAG TPA: hypothetical protein ENK72_02005 [Epsilonproteobacteria bacterium]|nr:hypothetical protein [Campylobacterota bacterium]
MLAIPVDINGLGATSSLLFGNVETFALYNPESDTFDFKKNEGKGNGIKTAELLKSWDVSRVTYSFLGDGPFNSMIKDEIDVFYVGDQPMVLREIVKGLSQNAFTKVETYNASEYLDPGTNTGNCECGCTHD